MKAWTLKAAALCLVLALVSVPVAFASPMDSHEAGIGSWLGATIHRLAEIVDGWIADTLVVIFEEDTAGSDPQGEDEDGDGATAVNPPMQNIGGVHIPNG